MRDEKDQQRPLFVPNSHPSSLIPHPCLLSLMLLLALSLSVPAGAEEPLWGEVASTLGKGFVTVTTGGLLQEFKSYRHHGGPVFLSIERMEMGATVEYGLHSDLDLNVGV